VACGLRFLDVGLRGGLFLRDDGGVVMVGTKTGYEWLLSRATVEEIDHAHHLDEGFRTSLTCDYCKWRDLGFADKVEFFTEGTQGKGQMNMDEELKPMPGGLAENQAAQAGMLLGLLKRVHALENLVGMDCEKEGWEAAYKSAQEARHDKLDAFERARQALREHDGKINLIRARGHDMGWFEEAPF